MQHTDWEPNLTSQPFIIVTFHRPLRLWHVVFDLWTIVIDFFWSTTSTRRQFPFHQPIWFLNFLQLTQLKSNQRHQLNNRLEYFNGLSIHFVSWSSSHFYVREFERKVLFEYSICSTQYLFEILDSDSAFASIDMSIRVLNCASFWLCVRLLDLVGSDFDYSILSLSICRFWSSVNVVGEKSNETWPNSLLWRVVTFKLVFQMASSWWKWKAPSAYFKSNF